MTIPFLEVFFAVATLVLLAVPAFILRKLKILGSESIAVLSAILLYVCMPFVTIDSLQNVEYDNRILMNMLYTFLLAFCLMFLVFFVFKLILCDMPPENCTRE